MSGNTAVDGSIPSPSNQGATNTPAPYGEGAAPISTPTRPQDARTSSNAQTQTTQPGSNAQAQTVTGAGDVTDANAAGPTDPNDLPEQRHAGAVGYGPNYQRGVGTGEKIAGTVEEIKGKILKKPDVAEHGHLRKTGELEKQTAEQEPDPFAKGDTEEGFSKPGVVAPEGTAKGESQAASENANGVKTIG